MIHNPVIDTLLNRKSIRSFKSEPPDPDVVETIVRAGQQAPFAYQLGSLLLSRDVENNPWNAPLYFILCVDSHRFERIMEQRGWEMASNDLSLLLMGIQDAALMAENMVTAAESLGLASCFRGAVPYYAEEIIRQFKLPARVFPLVGLGMGYPASNPPVRPRYPLEFCLFEDEYPQLTPDMIQDAMREMDEGYLAQDYYRKANYIIPLDGNREESLTFENYSWSEHISRKLGLWQRSPQSIQAALRKCGFNFSAESQGDPTLAVQDNSPHPIQAIGVIHSPYHEGDEVPIQAARSTAAGQVEVFPEYAAGLQDVEGFSHLILLYSFHRSSGFDLQVKPFLDDRPRGLFATRYPARPNQIGMSVVGLESRHGNILHIHGADVLDGTPLLDIKPYVPDFDAPGSVRTGWYEKRKYQ